MEIIKGIKDIKHLLFIIDTIKYYNVNYLIIETGFMDYGKYMLLKYLLCLNIPMNIILII